jgi:VanZ family protein
MALVAKAPRRVQHARQVEPPVRGVTLAMALVIAYGSLYPFDFSLPLAGPGPCRPCWQRAKPGRGDFLADAALCPLGFCCVDRYRSAASYISVSGSDTFGAILSISMELVQYYDVGRDTSAPDVYANVLGSALGELLGMIFGGFFHWPLMGEITANRIPVLLVLAWAAYRLHPFVPTIDLHKYWNALKPIVLTPNFSGYDLFRHTAIWLTIFTLVSKIAATLRPSLLVPLFAAIVLSSKILIVSTTLSVAEVAGAVAAYLIWLALHRRGRGYLAIVIVLFSATIVAQRLQPFQFTTHSVPFGWIPFRSFMQGSIDVDVLSFLEKFFLYGGLIWLLGEAGLSRRAAAGIVAATLFATSITETYLPHRSAEITDALMAILIAVIFALVTKGDAASKRRIGSHRRGTVTAGVPPPPARPRSCCRTLAASDTTENPRSIFNRTNQLQLRRLRPASKRANTPIASAIWP